MPGCGGSRFPFAVWGGRAFGVRVTRFFNRATLGRLGFDPARGWPFQLASCPADSTAVPRTSRDRAAPRWLHHEVVGAERRTLLASPEPPLLLQRAVQTRGFAIDGPECLSAWLAARCRRFRSGQGAEHRIACSGQRGWAGLSPAMTATLGLNAPLSTIVSHRFRDD
jgi:hypothetical protein